MKNLELYFLRSFEQDIAKDILYYAARLDDTGQTLDAMPQLARYIEHYGVYPSDVGVYAMLGGKVAGAAWVRLLKGENQGFGHVDETTPELVFGVKPEFRNQGIGTKIMEQLLHDAALSFSQISLAVREGSPVIRLYERLGFEKIGGSESFSEKRQLTTFKMLKVLTPPASSPEDAKWFESTQKWRMPQ